MTYRADLNTAGISNDPIESTWSNKFNVNAYRPNKNSLASNPKLVSERTCSKVVIWHAFPPKIATIYVAPS